MKVILMVVVMSLPNVFCGGAGDICQDVTCQHGGTCVPRTDDFWWCECDLGWTGRNCEQNACEKKKYLRIAGHSLDKLGGDLVHLTNTDPYSCMERCEKLPELFDLPICKAFFFQFSSKECGHWLNLDHSVVADPDRDFYIYCDCNNYFDQNPYFIDSGLSPTCYMTSTSSVVQLTCPDGFVFAENKASTIEAECKCGEDTGYLAINASCLFLEDTTVGPNQATTITAENDQSTAPSTTSVTWEEWTSWSHEGSVGTFQRQMSKKGHDNVPNIVHEQKRCTCIVSQPVSQKKLQNHVIQTVTVPSQTKCVYICTTTLGCVSVNIQLGENGSETICELNNAAMSSVSEADSEVDPAFVYYELDISGCRKCVQ